MKRLRSTAVETAGLEVCKLEDKNSVCRSYGAGPVGVFGVAA